MIYDIGLEGSPKDYHRKQLINELNQLRSMFDEANDEIIDTNSQKRILNGDTKHLWFRDNVAFYFSTGKILDDDDKELLTNILSYFDYHKRTYLGNFYKILSYKDPVIQKFEKKLNIGNGNYHFILIVISYPIIEDIKYAPDPKFMNRGVVDYYVDINIIKQKMMEYIREYGIVSQLEESFTTVDPVTVNNSFTHRDIQWAIGQEIDHDLMKSNITSTPVRTRVQPSQRDKIHAIDVRDTIPLNTRTQVKGFDILSIPIPYRSVYSRTTDTIQANPKQHTFQLYDSEEDYMMKVMP